MSKELQEKTFNNTVSIIECLQAIDSKINLILKQKTTVFQFDESQNAIAAVIIKAINEKIEKCECIEKYFGKLKDELKDEEYAFTFEQGVLTPKKILKKEPSEEEEKPKEEKIEKPFGLHKYSYPNYEVGNASLGSSGNPNALKWPFDK